MDKVTRHSSTFMITDILRSEPLESKSSEMNSTSDELRENGDMASSGDKTVHPISKLMLLPYIQNNFIQSSRK